MTKQSKGKIFLAEERGINQAEKFCSRNTFNFGKYFNEHKQPFGDIYIINDEVLDAGCSLSLQAEDFSYIVLLPVMGAITFNYSSGENDVIAAGQAKILTLDKGAALEISNPFKEGLVNYLQIWIKADHIKASKGSYLCTYDVNKNHGELLKISPVCLGTSSLPFSVWIGKFKGREEAIYHLQQKKSGLFIFVIEGAFEVEGRLLHARDGLALWEIDNAEIEALSNHAIIMVIESLL